MSRFSSSSGSMRWGLTTAVKIEETKQLVMSFRKQTRQRAQMYLSVSAGPLSKCQ